MVPQLKARADAQASRNKGESVYVCVGGEGVTGKHVNKIVFWVE
jgi:hypothetical protein